MTSRGLLLRNLGYHWRGNLAVFLGVALGAAVLTGALFVGDSLRGSLRDLTLDQLGWVEQALTPGRFFRADLAKGLPGVHAPVLLLQGSAATTDEATKKTRTTGKVTVLGVDEHFWRATEPEADASWSANEPIVVLNQTLADDLGVEVGATIGLNLQKNDAVPRETLLGKRDDAVQAVTVTVKTILPDQGMARFTLRPSPEPVRNAFVPLSFLQQELRVPGKANAVLSARAPNDIQGKLAAALTLDDWNLKLRTPADRAMAWVRFLDPRDQSGLLRKKLWEGRVPEPLARQADAQGNLPVTQIVRFYETERPWTIVESADMFLDAATERALNQAYAGAGFSTLIYLADSITDGQVEMPYAVIAAVEPQHLPKAAPGTLRDDEIALVTWPGMPLRVKIGDAVTVEYFVPDSRNQLQKASETFRVGLLIPLQGNADDPDWTPEFPGITDKLKISEWDNPPFPYNPKRVKPIDEQYWARHRATPKAYVTLATGQRLWANRFGKITSVRVPSPAPDFEKTLLKALRPESGGFVFQNVRQQTLQASTGSADFGVLFLSFSFFLIAAALLLVGLLFRLNLDRRAAEIGLLLATGWSHCQVRWLLLAEGLALALIGAAVGLGGALLYGSAMLDRLAASWPGEQQLPFLRLHAEPSSFAIGYVASVAVSLLTILWATRVLGNMAPRALLAGETTASVHGKRQQGRHWNGLVVVVSLLGAAACLVAGTTVTGHEAKAGSFFGAGALLLTAALALAWRWLRSEGGPSDPQPSLGRLGVRNAGRHPVRSALTVGLLGSATFLVVAVEAFHRETGQEFFEKTGSSGGFTLLAETDVPVFQDLNDPKTQLNWNVSQPQAKALADAKFYGLRVRQGDDASCLNLYQPLKPRVLGMPASLRAENRFHFAGHQGDSPGDMTNPWRLLERRSDTDGAIPAILDANTAQWILKVGLGETLEVDDEQGNQVKVRIVALLKESIFQGEIIVAEEEFLRLFPRQEGFQVFLVESDPGRTEEVRNALQTALIDQGVQVQSTIGRLQSYFAVENMYLDTFKALGGLGLLLGAVGLAIVLLRGVWERRGELALLRALGFRGGQLAWLVLAENAMLLALGLASGTAAALLAVAPHLVGRSAGMLWARLAFLLGWVVIIGLASGLAAVCGSLRAPVMTALRRE